MILIFQNYIKDAFSIDLRALALFRIGLGLTLLFFLFHLSQDITMFFTDEGLLSRAELIQLYSAWPLNWRHSVYLLNGNNLYFYVLFIIQFISATFFMLGYKTKLNCFISWFLLLSLQNRNLYIMSGFDLYLRLLLFWGFFLPLNAKLSFDSVNNQEAFKNKYFSVATFAILIQITLLYLLSALLKDIDDKWWVHHTALNYIIHNYLYLTPFGFLIHDLLSNQLLRLVTISVLFIEILTPLVLFFPIKKIRENLRIFWFVTLLDLHLLFRMFLYIGPFLLISIVAIIIILPEKFWDKIQQNIQKNNFRYNLNKFNTYTNLKNKFINNKLTNNKFIKIELNLPLISKVFISISLAVVVTINYFSYNEKYKYKLPIIHEYSEIFGLDQYWGFFNRPATISHMLRFYGIDELGNERPLWPIDNYGPVITTDIRQYFYAIKNNWWWKYFISYNIPSKNYNYFRENCLIRSLCKRENRKNDTPPIKRIKILYNWYPQLYDQNSTNLTSYGQINGWYYIQQCPN